MNKLLAFLIGALVALASGLVHRESGTDGGDKAIHDDEHSPVKDLRDGVSGEGIPVEPGVDGVSAGGRTGAMDTGNSGSDSAPDAGGDRLTSPRRFAAYDRSPLHGL